MTQEILPPEQDPLPDQAYTPGPDDLPPALAFTPVPRKRRRSNGLTPMRQRAFIAYLAANGSVEMSAKAIGASDNSLYLLKKAEAAESFAAAWDAAVEMGARRVLDTMMSHAIHGTPERVYQGGELVLERRKFNTRAMMWIVQQRFPESYGGSLNVSGAPRSALPHSIRKLKEQWHAEWQKEWEAKHSGRATEEETNAALLVRLKILHKRNQQLAHAEYLDDPEKRAACEVLYGKQNWDAIREAAEREARNGAFPPEQLERMGVKQLE